MCRLSRDLTNPSSPLETWYQLERPLATVAVGAAVRKGAPKPDISTPEGLKMALLAAKSITYPNPAGGAAAGVSFDLALKKLGIAETVQPKLKRAQGGANAMKMTANGEAELGFTFMSEMEAPGLDVSWSAACGSLDANRAFGVRVRSREESGSREGPARLSVIARRGGDL